MFLSDIVAPDSIIARSVNIERDLGDRATLTQYILTEKGLEIVGRFIAALKGEKISSWSLTGPYGMGKSSFVNFLIALCGAEKSEECQLARNILLSSSESLHNTFLKSLPRDFKKTQKGFLRVVATSSFESINRTLAKALLGALNREFKVTDSKNPAAKLVAKVSEFIKGDTTDTALLTQYIKQAGKLYSAPVVIVLDEFGKNLEYMAQHPGMGDVYILQVLAESSGVFVWVCLHQAFEEYASELSSKQLQEWGKIQGRFEDISFVEPQQQMIRFICHTLKKINGAAVFDQQLQEWAEYYVTRFKTLSLPGQISIDLQKIKDCYPLHPLVVYSLPELCTRFAQNDRTLFAFLCGGDPYALPHFLHHHTIQPETESLATYGLTSLYDYFLAITNSSSMNKPEGKRWFEVNTIIEESRSLPADEQELIKTIGLLNLLAKPTSLRASKDITSFAVASPDCSSSKVIKKPHSLLKKLIGRGLLIYREYADEYRLWEGTDIDIASSLEKYKERAAGFVLEDMLEKTAPFTPLIASRHSYQTGTLRYFERRWSSQTDLHKNITCSSQDADGLLVYCFGSIAKLKKPPEKTDNGRPVIVAYVQCEKQLREAVIEAAATKNMLAQSSELARDGVARKEARYRAQIAEKRLRKLLNSLYSPGNAAVHWYVTGEKFTLSSHRGLSELLSTICFQIYGHCPVIRNELINRNKLSSATARARRELIEFMVTRAEKPVLGMQGTGPEVAIYRTMLLAEELHKETREGYWKLVAPNQASSFYAAWGAIDTILEQAELDGIPLSDIIKMLQKPPFGLKYGPIPILLCLYLLVKSEEVALYREKSFLPYLSPEEMELMVKRPDLFTVKRFAPTGIRNEIFGLYQKLLNTSTTVGENTIRNANMVSVVGPLIQFANGLSEYVLQTKTISRKAQNIRRVLLNSKDPIHLLFEELPQALNFEPFPEESDLDFDIAEAFQSALREALLELTKADQLLYQEIGSVVQVVFGKDSSLKGLKEDLARRAAPLVMRCADKRLKPFFVVLTKQTANIEDWLIALATIVNQRPVDSWRDTDLQIFSTRLHDFSDRFQALESVVTAELKIPAKRNNQEIRHVSIMNSSGKNHRKIIRVKKKTLSGMKSMVSELNKTLADDELEALLLLIGDQILSEEQN